MGWKVLFKRFLRDFGSFFAFGSFFVWFFPFLFGSVFAFKWYFWGANVVGLNGIFGDFGKILGKWLNGVFVWVFVGFLWVFCLG